MANIEISRKTKIKVNGLEEAMIHLKEHELQHTLRFSAFITRKDFGHTGKKTPYTISFYLYLHLLPLS